MRAKRKMIATMVAIVLVACTGLILIGNLSKGFQNMDPTEWQLREVNEDNLYQAMNFADDDGVLSGGENGVTVSIDDDNIIKVSGTAEEATSIPIGTYTLKKGTSYVFNSGMNGSKGTAYLKLTNVNNDAEVKSCYNSTVVIPGDELVEDITVKLELVLAEDCSLNNVKIKPILCVGTSVEDLVEFWK